MSVLVAQLKPARSDDRNLEIAFERTFRPAIEKQPGFISVQLLRGGNQHLLIIEFVDEEHREAWVQSNAHSQAWPAMEAAASVVSADIYSRVPEH